MEPENNPPKNSLEDLRIDRRARRGPQRLLWVLAVIPLLLIVAGGVWRFRETRAATVSLATVRESRQTAPRPVLNASGYVTARRQATVSSKITGKILEVLVEEGVAVREGDIVARLDESTARVNLALAEAQLAAARRSLSETEVRSAEAKRNLGRTQALAEGRIASQAQLEAAQAEVDSLEARLALGREEVSVAERQVAVRRQDIEDTVIRAPFSGVVTSKDAQPGEIISPVSAGGGFTRTGICTLVDMASLEIEVDVNESYIARVQPGQPVEATLDAYPDWRIPARVITPVPAADRQKATVRVRIALQQRDSRILPDMGVKVSFLEKQEAKDATPASDGPRLLVPKAAVRSDAGRDVVYVINGNQVERRAVQLGPVEGDEVVVVAGLSVGEQVVVDGPEDLADGSRVSAR